MFKRCVRDSRGLCPYLHVFGRAFYVAPLLIQVTIDYKIKEKYPNVIKQIRGKGFLIGIQLYKDQTEFIKKLMNNQLLTIRAAENVVRILPPLNVKKNEIDLAIKIIEKVCSQIK